MTAYRRNVAVGLTVLVALIGLATMLLKFGGSTVRLFKQGHEIDVHFVSSRADGLAEGGQIKYQGVSVGRITRIRRDPGGNGVITDATIDTTPPLPGNVHGFIRQQGLIGGSAEIDLEIATNDVASTDPLVDGKTLQAKFIGADLIPQQFNDLATQLDKATRDLDTYIADQKILADIKASIANFHTITDSINKSSANVERFSGRLDGMGDQANGAITDARSTVTVTRADIEKLSKQIDDRMLQLTKSLDEVQAIAAKINNGQGTAGMLVNDPRLYNNLVEVTRQMSETIAVIKRLAEQWEQEGISFKLK